MYVTGDTKSLNVYKSRNMVDWELAGKAFAPEADSWAQQQVYAPECIYEPGRKEVLSFFYGKRFRPQTRISCFLIPAQKKPNTMPRRRR